MKAKPTTIKSIMEYVDTPTKVRKLVSLVPSEDRAFVRALIRVSTDTKTSLPDQLAQYYHRLAQSVVELEAADAKKATELGKQGDPVKWFHIGHQGSLQQDDPDLGICAMRYFRYSEITSGWFSGNLFLEPKVGGLTFAFLNGIPEGATLSIFLNWSSGHHKAVASPTSTAIPRTMLTGFTPREGPDFQWTIVRPNTHLMICITDDNPYGTVAAGADCRVSYY